MRSIGAIGISFLLGTTAVAAQDVRSSSSPIGALGDRTFVWTDVACADLPANGQTASALRVAAGHVPEHRNIFGRGETIVLNAGTPAGLAVDQRYFVRRLHTGRSSAGFMSESLPSIRTAGWLTVTAVDDRFALARIDYACDVMMAGDYLEPFVEPALPVAESDGPTRFSESALVLSGTDRREVFGAGDVLSIHMAPGTAVALGTPIAFYRDRGANKLADLTAPPTVPLIEIGEGVVVSVTGDRAQVAVKASRDAVRRGDFAFPKGR